MAESTLLTVIGLGLIGLSILATIEVFHISATLRKILERLENGGTTKTAATHTGNSIRGWKP